MLAQARRVRRPLPAVFALGGVDEHNVASFLQAGAHGMAVMGSVMSSPDPAQTVAALLAKVGGPGACGGGHVIGYATTPPVELGIASAEAADRSVICTTSVLHRRSVSEVVRLTRGSVRRVWSR